MIQSVQYGPPGFGPPGLDHVNVYLNFVGHMMWRRDELLLTLRGQIEDLDWEMLASDDFLENVTALYSIDSYRYSACKPNAAGCQNLL
jgi:hypothetical protein